MLRQQPDLVLEHLDLTFAEQHEAVRLGEVDVALIQNVGELDGLELERILSSPPVAVVPAESPLGRRRRDDDPGPLALQRATSL